MADLLSFARRGPAASPMATSRRSFTAPQTGGRRAALTAAVLLAIAGAAAAAGALTDLVAPTPTEWRITGVLAIVAVAGLVVGHFVGPSLDGSGPPWDAHTVWLLPAAMLTPPAAFGCLLALSVAADLCKSAHQMRLRLVVVSITVTTTMAVHAASALIDNFALAGIVGIAALWLFGCIVALVVSSVFVNPNDTALWLDYRWTWVVLGCAASGLLVAAAMRSDVPIGLVAVAPLLLAQFSLRWPELTRFARIDSKTGLPNFQNWDDRSRSLLAAAELHGTDAAVLIVDLDRFKSVNDNYGHLAGDQVLTEVSGLLLAQLTSGDLIGRFGGEEFVVTLFDREADDALATAERIRAAVAAQSHRLVHSTAPAPQGGPGTTMCAVTCSIGVASARSRGYDVTALLEAADQALAEAKLAGRNRVRRAASPADAGPAIAARQESVTVWDVAAVNRQRSASR